MENPQDRVIRPQRERAIWAYLLTLLREMPGKVTGALVLMIFLSLMEGIGLLMLVPLLQLVGLDLQQGTLDRIAQFLYSIFQAVGIHPTLITVLVIYVLIISLHALLHRWQTTAIFSLNHEFVVHLRQWLYRAITYANWLFLSRSRMSDFTHVLTNEVQRVGVATFQILRLCATSVVTIVYVLFALKISVTMTILVFACGGGLVLLLRKKMQSAREAGEGTSKAMNDLYAAITEQMGGLKTAKSYGAQDRHVHIFSRLTEQVHHTYVRAIQNQAEVKYWFDIGAVLILSLIVYMCFEVLAFSTAEVLLLMFLFVRIMPRFSSIQQDYQGFLNALPAFISVVKMQARCEAAAEPGGQSKNEVHLHHAIQLERVTFGYQNRPVIYSLDLKVPAGETTAIVGPSGAGKSTVADLIMGLLIPNEGRVAVDANPLLPARLQPWREQIGYVEQETFLFHDTVRANLLWANPAATEEDMHEALGMAAAEEFVLRLPKGPDTVVGDRGVRLSGGERQRLALARALLRKPTLLILDEATSDLDSENEQRIQHAIEKLHGSMTILVISHRLSTVRGSDIIYVLEEGKLVESESWDALIAKKDGRFRALCLAQGMEL